MWRCSTLGPRGGVRRQRDPRGRLAATSSSTTPSFSSDEHWRLLMDENAEVARHGTINSVAEGCATRACWRRTSCSGRRSTQSSMDRTALNQFKRIKSSPTCIKMYQVYGGATRRTRAARSTPNIKPRHAARVRGEAARARRRVGRPSPARPERGLQRTSATWCRSTATRASTSRWRGRSTRKNVPINIHPEQRDPNRYYDEDGYFSPPRMGAREGRHVDPARPEHHEHLQGTLPAAAARQRRAGRLPAPGLLGACRRTRTRCCCARSSAGARRSSRTTTLVMSLFHKMEETLDPEQEPHDPRGAWTRTCSAPTRSTSRPSRRSRWSAASTARARVEKQGDMWVVSHQQALKDISQRAGKLRLDDRRGEQEARRDAINAAAVHGILSVDAATAHVERRAKHAETTHALICLGLQRFENAYARKRARRTIPPGWFDICYDGAQGGAARGGRDRGAARQRWAGPSRRPERHKRVDRHGQHRPRARPLDGGDGRDALWPLARLPHGPLQHGLQDQRAPTSSSCSRSGTTVRASAPLPAHSPLRSRVPVCSCAQRSSREDALLNLCTATPQ